MSRIDWTPKIWAVQQRVSADWRAQRAEEALPARAESATVLKNQDFSAFVDFLKRSCGFDFTGYKPAEQAHAGSRRGEFERVPGLPGGTLRRARPPL